MRLVLATVLALLALAPACNGDDPGGTEPTDDRTRGERCDDMQACGRMECAAEIEAVRACATDIPCSEDPASLSPLQESLAECLQASDCNTTSCDLVGAFTDGGRDLEPYCESDSDAELLLLAWDSMYADPADDVVAECQALE